ncbi:hypothetical protein NA56DRAFT_750562 [Hyaloscypha hepaticicola]|uniref:Uncharacterized protein n=1 Tax=Hyaloscypha hepaticicola TaxID=2082293 RepID=A0A2J6PZL4_9HELO|nr:hypothetical protein NA56DRAFT_750562 [Hyaloscypha hepaticicola]
MMPSGSRSSKGGKKVQDDKGHEKEYYKKKKNEPCPKCGGHCTSGGCTSGGPKYTEPDNGDESRKKNYEQDEMKIHKY